MPRQSMGGFSAPPKAENMNQGINSIMPFVSQMAMMNAMGQRGQVSQAATPQGSDVTEVKNIATGATTKTPGDIEHDAKIQAAKGATDDIGRLQQLLPALDSYEKTYDKVYGQSSYKSGPAGRAAATMTSFDAKHLQNDPEATTLIASMEGHRQLLAGLVHDASRLPETERANLLNMVPRTGSILDKGIADTYDVGKLKLQNLRQEVYKNMGKLFQVSKTGDMSVFMQPEESSNTVPGLNKNASSNASSNSNVNPNDEESIFQAWKKANP